MSASKVEVGRSLPGAGKDRQRDHENLPHVAKFIIKVMFIAKTMMHKIK
jgi:hypothetical protein